MKRVVLALAVLAGSLLAQTGQDPNENIQKLVTLKYADPNSIQNLLFNFGVAIRSDQRLKVLALSGKRSAVTTLEEAIKQLDVPSAAQKDIDLTVYFVIGSDAAEPGPLPPPIPADLKSTAETLKSTFPYKNYYLLDALSLRARAGSGADASGQLSNSRLSTFKVRSASLEADGTTIKLEGLHAGLRIPVTLQKDNSTYLDTGMTTEMIDVKEGQKLVIGRSSLDGPNKALFLILIGKIAQ